MKKIWFKAKKFGWGWYPVTWQGWLATIAYIAYIVWTSTKLESAGGEPTQALLYYFLPRIFLATALLILISILTGEKPKWHWGEND